MLVSLVSFTAITLCVVSQRVFVVSPENFGYALVQCVCVAWAWAMATQSLLMRCLTGNVWVMALQRREKRFKSRRA